MTSESPEAESYSISVVVPVYNSAGSLTLLVERLQTLLQSITSGFEVILVNDGSRDNSLQVIRQLVSKYHNVYGINLMRNYGQHNALLCGIRMAKHDVIVTLDDDLQHPPEEIPLLLCKLAEGYDVVYGTPHTLPHSWWRNLSSRFTKRILARTMGIQNVREISAFRVFKRDLREAFANYQSPKLLLDVLLSWGTNRFAAIEVKHEPRLIGKSNYDLFKLFNQTMLILTGFSTGPLRLASLTGFAFTFFGLVVLVYVVGRFVVEGSVPGFPFLASTIAVFSGAQLFALGIIGEYLARIFTRTMEQPTYVIQEKIRPQSFQVLLLDEHMLSEFP